MFSALCKLLLKLWGWKIDGSFPDLKKYVIIIAPHTSNWDFYLCVLVRGATKLKANFLGKSSLFNPPQGYLFRALGGHPVDRSKHTKLVDKVIEIYQTNKEFRLAMAPEGTRKKVKEWKTGFYYIAHGAAIPIVISALDYGTKTVKISEPYYTSGNLQHDLEEIKSFYIGVEGKYAS